MKTLRLCTFHLICLTVSLSLLSTITEASETSTVKAGRLQTVTGPHLVRFANGYLTVKVQDVSLRDLLDEIARQSGLTVMRYVTLDQRVTLEFHHLSLERGLRCILRHRSFVLEYAQQTPEERLSAVARPKTLWILPQGDEFKFQVLATDVGDKETSAESCFAVATPQCLDEFYISHLSNV